MVIELSRQYRLINLLAQRERAIGDLYLLFAGMDQNNRAFWQSLSDDESQHADLLMDLISDISAGSLNLQSSKINIREIQNNIKYVKSLGLSVLNSGLSPDQAIKEAYNIENSLLESQIFDQLGQLAPAMAEIFQVLNNSTRRHTQRISNQMNAVS